MSSAQDLIAPLTDYLQENGSITRRTFEQHFGLHRSTAAIRLQQLTAQGILTAEGENRKRTYRLTKPI